MEKQLTIGVDVPQHWSTEEGPESITRFASTAESRGFGSLWVLDSDIPGVLSAFPTLSYVAAACHRATLGIAVLVSHIRSPLLLARDVGSLVELHPHGEVIIGVGLGNDRRSNQRHGLAASNRVDAFEKSMTALRGLLTDSETSMDGPWQLERAPRPFESERLATVPIWVGARSPNALRRAVRLGDGWIGAGSMSMADFEEALALAKQMSRDTGRVDFRFARRVYLQMEEPTDAVTRAVGDWFEWHYGRRELAQRVVIYGKASEIERNLERHIKQGISHLILHPVVNQFDQMVALSEEVLPAFQG